jgi:two-component system, OmpR family, catabolic regulation response regulator CreB
MARVLLVEDEVAIADAVQYALRAEGLQVEHCLLGVPALERLRRERFDVVVLDVGLPDLDGFALCRQLRGFSQVPVIFLSARDAEVDRVVGLELGADDYVTKPFSPRELVARVRARLRRGEADAQSGAAPRDHGDFSHDAAGQRIRFRGQWLALTRYEYLLLAALLARPGAILSRERLMDEVWGDAPDTVDRTVDTHVKTLRAKLRQAAADADPIRTHRGLGYSLEAGG